ncbi:MAG: SLOG family protein [Acutalibacteraceae bacterium]
MITCVFAGHRQIYEPNIGEKVKKTLEKLIESENRAVFLNGGMGRFDDMCAEAVRKLKEQHPEKDIRLCLVAAYLSNRFNTEKSYYQTFYDEILLPEDVEYTYYKAAVTKRNRWMVDHADLMLAYIDHDYGGAYQTYRYAQKKSVPIINIAEGAAVCLK